MGTPWLDWDLFNINPREPLNTNPELMASWQAVVAQRWVTLLAVLVFGGLTFVNAWFTVVNLGVLAFHAATAVRLQRLARRLVTTSQLIDDDLAVQPTRILGFMLVKAHANLALTAFFTSAAVWSLCALLTYVDLNPDVVLKGGVLAVGALVVIIVYRCLGGHFAKTLLGVCGVGGTACGCTDAVSMLVVLTVAMYCLAVCSFIDVTMFNVVNTEDDLVNVDVNEPWWA